MASSSTWPRRRRRGDVSARTSENSLEMCMWTRDRAAPLPECSVSVLVLSRIRREREDGTIRSIAHRFHEYVYLPRTSADRKHMRSMDEVRVWTCAGEITSHLALRAGAARTPCRPLERIEFFNDSSSPFTHYSPAINLMASSTVASEGISPSFSLMATRLSNTAAPSASSYLCIMA
jgi:hypothetical protein